MAVDYNTLLATRVVHEQKPITYRLLSREQKINVTVAKKVLYAFYDAAKKQYPGQVHATYAIAGVERVATPADEDTVMSDALPSSQPTDPDSSQAESEVRVNETTRTTFQLVQQEDLEEVKLRFDRIDMIYVYSLEPAPLSSDLVVLSDCQRAVREMDVSGGLELFNTIATCQNPKAKQSSKPIQITPPSAPAGRAPAPSKKADKPTVGSGDDKSSLAKQSSAAQTKKPTQRPFQLSTTSKPKPKVKTEAQESVQESGAAKMLESTKEVPVIKKEKPATKAASSTKPAEVSQELQSMFSDNESDQEEDAKSDVDMIDEVDEAPMDSGLIGEPAEVPDDSASTSANDTPDSKMDSQPAEDPERQTDSAAEVETEEPVAVDSTAPAKPKGRKRGTRKVEERVSTMENGFMVRKTVTKWVEYSESESESEAVSVPAKAKPASSKPERKTSPAVKAEPAEGDKDTDSSDTSSKKGGVKKKGLMKGQGSLMSFFKKK
ncbi:DNA polymerase subunit Cdc27 [Myxozyma melibiosi]|uniref:DNA polymerase delta subunit 3 n=1 Tax=Myxozyma melibiosi TaxID=54550 RepID=A0ABR1FE89_9ASCO